MAPLVCEPALPLQVSDIPVQPRYAVADNLPGNAPDFLWNVTWLYGHIEPAVGIVTERSLAGGGVVRGKGSLCRTGRGGFLPNGNPNKGSQVLENGKLIPIMIPRKPPQLTEPLLSRCSFYCSYSIIQLRLLQFLFASPSSETRRTSNKNTNKQKFNFVNLPCTDEDTNLRTLEVLGSYLDTGHRGWVLHGRARSLKANAWSRPQLLSATSEVLSHLIGAFVWSGAGWEEYGLEHLCLNSRAGTSVGPMSPRNSAQNICRSRISDRTSVCPINPSY
jgi:hypothetical protein